MKRTSFCFCIVSMILLSIFLVFIHDVDRRGQERVEQLKAEVVQAVKERDDTRSELDALKAESSESINERKKVQEDAAQQRNTLREQLRQLEEQTSSLRLDKQTAEKAAAGEKKAAEDLNAKLQAADQKAEHLIADVAKCTEDLKKSKEQVREKLGQAEALELRLKDAQAEDNKDEAVIAAGAKELHLKDDEIENLKKEISKLHEEAAKFRVEKNSGGTYGETPVAATDSSTAGDGRASKTGAGERGDEGFRVEKEKIGSIAESKSQEGGMEGGNKFAEKGQQIEARGVEDSSKLQDTGSNAVGEEKSAEGDGGAAFKRKDGGAKGYKEDEEGEVKAEALDHKDVANP